MSVQDDIKCAKYLIENGESEHDKTFHLNSAVYETTNEFLYAYRHLFVGQKSMLAPIGSCEQIFNAILEGIEEVDAFDISRFPKYFLYLGKAVIESLTIEEYIEFFHGPNFDDISYYNSIYHNKIEPRLSGDAKVFWSSLFQEYYWINMRRRFYKSADWSSKLYRKNNKFLLPEYYGELRARLKDARISVKTGDIVDLAPGFSREYGVIHLSNLHQFIDQEEFRKILNELKLTPDGVMIIAGAYGSTSSCDEIFEMKGQPYVFTKKDGYIEGRIA